MPPASAMKRKKSPSKETTAAPSNDMIVYVPHFQDYDDMGNELSSIGEVYQDKWAANKAVMEHEGYIYPPSDNVSEELNIEYDDEDLLRVHGTIGEGEPINWRTVKHHVNKEVGNAAKCREMVDELVEEGAVFHDKKKPKKRAKTK